MNEVEQVIRKYIGFGKRTNSGFEEKKCALCNDYKVRAGFKFDGESILYKCFNCSALESYDEKSYTMRPGFRALLTAFGVPETEINQALSAKFFNPSRDVPGEPKKIQATAIPVKAVNLPAESYLLKDAPLDDIWREVAIAYLESRGLSIDSHDWYLSSYPIYRQRLIIPFYRNDQLIYWQARAFDDEIKTRYLNPATDRDGIIFNHDELYRYTTEPLFVTEGVFNAISIGQNAIALTSADLSKTKIDLLKKVTSRKIVFIIDKDYPAYKLGKIAINNEWSISYFDSDDIKDASQALELRGKLWMLHQLMTNICEGFQAQVQLQLLCQKAITEYNNKKNEARKTKTINKLHPR